MPCTAKDVISVAEDVIVANECFRESGSELAREQIGVEVVLEDVRGGRDEDRRRLQDNDILWGEECFEVVEDCCLCVFCLLWGSCMPVFRLSCVVGEGIYDDNVVGVECCAFDCVECLGECVGFMGCDVEIGCTCCYVFERVNDFVCGDIL